MKTANTILSHLTSRPQFKYLKTQECYKKYIQILSPKWQKAVAFVYIKDNTLFIAVKHPGFKQELNYNKDLLKSLLKQLNTYVEPCKDMVASEVVIFHSRYYPMENEKVKYESVPYYKEQSSANFELPKEKDLKNAFLKIQKTIKCNRQ